MNIYNIWCDLKPGVGDLDFSDKLAAYLGHLKDQGLIENWRLMRRKLGLGPPTQGEFHVMIEVHDLTQLDAAFGVVSSRRDPVETHHFSVNSLVQNATFALYRDFPDAGRHHGGTPFPTVTTSAPAAPRSPERETGFSDRGG